MKKLRNYIAIAGLGLIFASCSITYPYTATNNPIGSKQGVSKTTIVFGAANEHNLGAGIVTNKNYGVVEAAKKGKVNKIATVDIKVTNYIIFRKAEIIVTGE